MTEVGIAALDNALRKAFFETQTESRIVNNKIEDAYETVKDIDA